MAAAGTHQNIVRYYSSWTEQQGGEQLFYILMEKCEESLSAKQMLAGHQFKEAELVDILRQVGLFPAACPSCVVTDTVPIAWQNQASSHKKYGCLLTVWHIERLYACGRILYCLPDPSSVPSRWLRRFNTFTLGALSTWM